MGILEEQKTLESKLLEVDTKLRFFVSDGTIKAEAARISSDGTLRVNNDKFETKEECIAMCQWYLNIASEL